ncbi:hypothetical protein PO909_006753 [Leuciscus waleckii]
MSNSTSGKCNFPKKGFFTLVDFNCNSGSFVSNLTISVFISPSTVLDFPFPLVNLNLPFFPFTSMFISGPSKLPPASGISASNFGLLTPSENLDFLVFGTLMLASGPLMLTSPLALISFSGTERLPPEDFIPKLGPLNFGNLTCFKPPSGPSMSRSGALTSISGPLISKSAFGRLMSTSGPSTLGPFIPNEGILIFGIFMPPSGPSISISGPSMSHFGAFVSPVIFGPETSTSPLNLGPFKFKLTSGIEIFGPDVEGILNLGPLILPSGPSMSRSGVLMSILGPLILTSAFGRLMSTSEPSTLGPLSPNDGILMFGILKPPSGPSKSGPSISTFGPLISPSILGTDTSTSPFIFGPFRLKSTSGIEIFGPDIDGILNLGPLIFPSGPSMLISGVLMSISGPLTFTSAFGRLMSTSGPSILGPLTPNDGILNFGILKPPSGPSNSGPSISTFGALISPSTFGMDTSTSPLSFGPFRLKSTSGIEIFGPDIDGILNLGPLIFPSGPSMSSSGPLISTSGALMSPLTFGTDTSTSPFSFGPFMLKSTSGIEIFGPDMEGILNLGPLIFPSGPSMSRSGDLMSISGPLTPTFAFGRLRSTSGPSTLGPLNPNDGILNLGIFKPPSGPSISKSGPSMSTFGAFMSPAILGPEISISPLTFGLFKLKSASGIEIFGPDIEGILNFGPLIFPSGPSMSRSGVLMSIPGPLTSIFAFGRLMSTSGPSNLGPLNPNDGILNLGIFKPPSGPSISKSGPSMFTFGAFMSPAILGPETFISPLTFGLFKLKSTSGIEIFGPDIDGILNLEPFIFPSGPSMSRSGPSTSTFAFGRLRSTSGPSTLGPLNPNDGILNLGIFKPPSGPSISKSGPSMSTFGAFMSPAIFGPEISISPLTFGLFKLKSTSGIEIFGPDIEGILNLGPFIFPSGPSMSKSGPSTSTFAFGRLRSTSGPSTLGPLNPNDGILNLGIFKPPSGPSILKSGPSMSTFGAFMSPAILGPEISISPLTFGLFKLKSTSGIEILGPDIEGILNLGPFIFPSGPSMSRSGPSTSTFAFGRLRSTSGPSTLGPLNPNDGILNLGIFKPPSGPSISKSGPSMSNFGAFMSPAILGPEISISPLTFGLFKLKSTSGIEIFGPDIEGILNLGPFIFPSGPSMSKSGPSTSTFAFGRLRSTSGPSTLGPLNPNDGILNLGIFKPPSGPSISKSGPSMSTFGAFMSPAILGPEISISPLTFGLFKLKSKSGIEIFGPDIEGILNLGPFIFPSGPSMSRSGPSTSTFAFGRLRSTSGPSTLGPLNPNDGILNLGIFKPPSGPSISKSGPSMSTFGAFMSPPILGPDISISPLTLGLFMLKSTSGIEIFGPDIEGILNLGPLIFPSGPSMSRSGVLMSMSGDLILTSLLGTLTSISPLGDLKPNFGILNFGILNFGFFTFASGILTSTLGPSGPDTDGIFSFGPLIFPSGPSMSSSGPLISTSGALMSPLTFGTDTLTSPLSFGPFRWKSTSGIEMFGPEIDGILNLGPLILPSGPSRSSSAALISISGALTSISAFGRLMSTSGPSTLGPLSPNDGILIFGILKPPSGPSRSGPSISTFGPLISPSNFGTATSTSPLSFGPFRLKSKSGIEMFGPEIDGILNLGPLIFPSGPSKSSSGPLISTSGALMSPLTFGTDTSTSPFSFGPFRLKSKSGIEMFGPEIDGILNLGPLIFPSGPSMSRSGVLMSISGPLTSTFAFGRLMSTSGPSTLGPLTPNDGILNFGILKPPSGPSRSGPSISTFGPLISPSTLGMDTSTSPLSFGPFRLKSTSGIEIFGPDIDGILNLGPLIFPSGPSMSSSGPLISTSGALMSPLTFGTDTSTSPFSFGPFRLKSTSGIEIFGPDMEGILNFGPLIFPSGPSMSRSGILMSIPGPLTSTFPFGRLMSKSGPSTLGPLSPNDGILIFGILKPPSGPSRSGPSISTFGPLISPSTLGTDTSISPLSFGPFRLKSTSGIEIFGPDIDGILNLGPLIFPSGPSMLRSGVLMSISGPLTLTSAFGRLMSTSGPSTLGPLTPNDGILNFGILKPPSGPSRSGPSISTFGALISPSTFGMDTSTSPLSFGPFRLKSTSGIEIFGPDIDGILNLGPLIFPSGPSISSSGPLISTSGALMSPLTFGTDTSTSAFSFGPFRLKSTSGIEIFGPDMEGILNLGPLIFPSGPSMSRSEVLMSISGPLTSTFPFGRLMSTSGPSTLGPLSPNDGILIFGILKPPSGPSRSGPSISTFGPLISPSTLGTDTSTSPLNFGPFRLKSTSGIEIFGPDIDGILNLGPLIFPSGPSMLRSGDLMSISGPLTLTSAFGRFMSTSGPSTLGPLTPNDGILNFGILKPPSRPSRSGPSISTFGALISPSTFGTDTSISPLSFGPFRLKSTSGIEIFGPDIDGILNFGPLIFPSGPSMSSSGPVISTSGALMSPLTFGTDTSTSPCSFGPFRLKSTSGIEIFGPDMEGILNLGPLIFPSGPSMSRSGVLMSISGPLTSTFVFGRLMSTSGPSTLGPLTPNDGILNFGILKPP